MEDSERKILFKKVTLCSYITGLPYFWLEELHWSPQLIYIHKGITRVMSIIICGFHLMTSWIWFLFNQKNWDQNEIYNIIVGIMIGINSLARVITKGALFWGYTITAPNATSDGDASQDAISFYGSYLLKTELINVAECKPEKSLYILKTHQTLTVNIFTDDNLDLTWCNIQGANISGNNKITVNISEKWKKTEYQFDDISANVTSVTCLLLSKLFSMACRATINIAGDVSDSSMLEYSGSIIHAHLITDVNEPYVVENLEFRNNSQLEVDCRKSMVYGATDAFALVRRDRNGSIQDLETNQNYYSAISEIQLNSSYDGDEIICVQSNRSMNTDWETAVRLHYRQDLPQPVNSSPLATILMIFFLLLALMLVVTAGFYYWTNRGKRKAAVANHDKNRDSHEYEEIPCVALGEGTKYDKACAAPDADQPRSTTPDSDDYAEIYDIVYEDRRRIEKVFKDKETKCKPPEPPPIETIPLQASLPALAKSPVTVATRAPASPTVGSLIPTSDLYLLHIDSEGYEIPDELKFIDLPLATD